MTTHADNARPGEAAGDGVEPGYALVPVAAPSLDRIKNEYPTNLLPDNTADMDLGELAELYRVVLDEKDAANHMLRTINAAEAGLRTVLRQRLNETGVEKFDAAGITISVADKEVVKIDDTKWDTIVSRLIADGQLHLVQRRITGSRVSDLVDAGYVLPDGMTLDSFETVKHRRSRRA